MKTITTNRDTETYALGKSLGEAAAPGEIYCLTGGLGAGKTVFAKGFAEGLGVSVEVTSPTFAIVQVYDGRLPFYHFDVYRIGDAEEMSDTGYEEYFYGGGVCLIEWAELIKELLPENVVWIAIEKDLQSGSYERRIIRIGEVL